MWVFKYLIYRFMYRLPHVESLHFSRCEDSEVWEFDEDSFHIAFGGYQASYNISCKKCSLKQKLRRATMRIKRSEAKEYLKNITNRYQ